VVSGLKKIQTDGTRIHDQSLHVRSKRGVQILRCGRDTEVYFSIRGPSIDMEARAFLREKGGTKQDDPGKAPHGTLTLLGGSKKGPERMICPEEICVFQ